MLTARERRVVAAVTADLLPPEPVLDGTTRGRVLADVAAFCVAQIEALPSFLRHPYRLALAGFDLLPLVRFGRAYRTLEPEARARWIAFWDERGGTLTRSFVKLLRSCALLAYFDHPLVAARLAAA